MDRRDFVRRVLGASVAAGVAPLLGTRPALLAPQENSPVDLVAVRGGEPDIMFDRGIEALGGMQACVGAGSTVVVKPNIGWDVVPERAGNANPLLVARIVRRCLEVGASKVYVFDHTCDDWKRCYRRSGIEEAAVQAGATVVSGGSKSYYHEVEVPGGQSLRSAMEHELVLEADVLINVPILKSHGGARLTAAMKNLMGVVWDRGFWHSNDLHQCIADFAAYRKPTLNVVDAYYVMKRNGPRGVSEADVVTMKAQLISADIVAVDTAAAKLFGVDPSDVRYIPLARDRKVGRMDLENLHIKRIVI
jgi:uncharacterized protein (DUF362 family)